MIRKLRFFGVCSVTVLTVFTGCGGSYDVHVPTVRVEHHLQLEEVEVYLRSYCTTKYNNTHSIESCVEENIGKFLATFR
jgi:hypothetical protein